MTDDPFKPTLQLRFVKRGDRRILQQLWELPADFGPTRLIPTEWRDIPFIDFEEE